MGEHHPICWEPEWNKDRGKRNSTFFSSLIELEYLILFSLAIRLRFILWAPLVLRSSDLDWIISLPFQIYIYHSSSILPAYIIILKEAILTTKALSFYRKVINIYSLGSWANPSNNKVTCSCPERKWVRPEEVFCHFPPVPTFGSDLIF